MKLTPKEYYKKVLTDKKYDSIKVESEFLKLNIDINEDKKFRVKSAILFLSRFQEEIESLVISANKDYESILNSATIKQERS